MADTSKGETQRGDSNGEETVQIVGSDGNVITVPTSVLIAAGVNVRDSEELSPEQVELILSMLNASDPSTSDGTRKAEKRPVEASNELQLVVTDSGDLRLTDTNGREFFFSRQQLAAQGIDVSQLTDNTISAIVAMAIPSGAAVHQATVEDHETTKRSRLDMSSSRENKRSAFGGEYDTQSYAEHRRYSGVESTVEIGDSIEFRRAGKVQTATVRYIRANAGYKVQFGDGHFEWIDEADIVPREAFTESDHQSYSGTAANDRREKMQASKKAEAASSAMDVSAKEANFCCPICARKVHQRSPAYIVIRVPACDECSKEKVMVLDERQQ